MYNRYRGNSGRVERVEDRPAPVPAAPPPAGLPAMAPPRRPPGPSPAERRPGGILSGMGGELNRLLRKLSPMNLETEDLLLILVLYLLYRESGDEEFLFMILGLVLF